MAVIPTCPRCGATLASAAAPCTRCILESGIEAQEQQPLGPGFLDDLPMPGDAIVIADKYRVLETLGRGGMGVVYKSWQENLDRIVAVKTMSAGPHASEVDRERFQREARVVAGLSHPAIVSIYDWGLDRGVPFFSMEYVEGRDLGKVLHDGLIESNSAAGLLADLADAVQYAHEQGIFHRDLKPSNVLIDRRGRPKITDFGLAKRIEGGDSLTMSGQLLGSIEYMPPEQVSAKKGSIGPWSDVYGLGAILYQVLTRRPPFTGENMPEVLQQVLNSPPVRPGKLNPSVPRPLEAICLKCLEKDPKQRYRSARELAEDLRRFLQSEPVQVKKPIFKRAVAVTAALLAIATVGAWWYISRPKESPPSPLPEATNSGPSVALTNSPPNTNSLANSNENTNSPPESAVTAAPEPTFPQPSRLWTNTLGMIFVPAGISNALVCIWETRLRDYAQFVAGGGLTNNAHWLACGFPQTTNDPVVNVSWDGHDQNTRRMLGARNESWASVSLSGLKERNHSIEKNSSVVTIMTA